MSESGQFSKHFHNFTGKETTRHFDVEHVETVQLLERAAHDCDVF